MSALRCLISQRVLIRRGDVKLAEGPLVGPLPLNATPKGKRLWGIRFDDDERLRIDALDPLDREVSAAAAV